MPFTFTQFKKADEWLQKVEAIDFSRLDLGVIAASSAELDAHEILLRDIDKASQDRDIREAKALAHEL